MKDGDKQTQGKRNKQRGAAWESKVRKDLETKGWNVTKFQSNVELYRQLGPITDKISDGNYDDPHLKGRLIPAKSKFNPFSKAMMLSSGFPDFLCWRIGQTILQFKEEKSSMELTEFKRKLSMIKNKSQIICPPNVEIKEIPEVIGVEAKSNGSLDKEEKAKCTWLLNNKIFSKILIAKKKKEGRKVVPEYVDFKEKYMVNKDDKKAPLQ